MLSFVIPAHNEAGYLAATLIALGQATAEIGQQHEIIVVDDASSDATAEIATTYGAKVLRVEHRHIAATRNAGAAHAQGEILFFVDADTCIDEKVVRAALHELDSGAVGGGASVRLLGEPAWHLRWATASMMWTLRVAKIAPGCFLYCTRTAFDAVGGFDQTLYAAEDVAISRTLAKLGRFVVLRETVATSDRKLRTFSLGEHLAIMFRFLFLGKRMLRSRKYLKLWYEDRRND